MLVDLTMAFYVVYGLSAIMLVFMATILVIKARKTNEEKQRKQVLTTYEDYLQYLLRNLDDPGAFQLPTNPTTKREKQVLQKELIQWMDRIKGNHLQKLVRLSEEMGLVDLDLKRLRSRRHYVRLDAAYNLGVMRCGRAVKPMLTVLEKNQRDSTMFILGRSIAQAATHANEVEEMIHHLGKRGHNNYQLLVDITKESNLDLGELYTRLIQEEQPNLIKVGLLGLREHAEPHMSRRVRAYLEAEDKEIRIHAVKLMIASGSWTKGDLFQFMKSDDWEVRLYIAKWIGDAKLVELKEVLEVGVKDPLWSVAKASAKSLLSLDQVGVKRLYQLAMDWKGTHEGEVALECIQEDLKETASNAENGFTTLQAYHQKLNLFEQFFGRDEEVIQAM
ncbi:hypothetical protein N781_05220 [Pontibacillus halophilus JSM 076056 = DSM 19796]|uniref:HEAT repeat domain-containing protein n=1 Tax=Pontibacillus halophilus JSM 076056 = DSM 19796 TaxID=1385510 RepID=A0A0A5GIX0_9BACI|nr:hypothetical protein [Pontibacillus halophilus]KGX91173.1 hypothetical protein N781_05220 [Pontibacillus halophilus JSM 076056 = DSM 19796]